MGDLSSVCHSSFSSWYVLGGSQSWGRTGLVAWVSKLPWDLGPPVLLQELVSLKCQILSWARLEIFKC